MSVRDLIPWGRNSENRSPSVYGDNEQHPFLSLHREMNRLFDEAFRGFEPRLPAIGQLQRFSGGPSR